MEITLQAARDGIPQWDQLAPGELNPQIWKNLEWIQCPPCKENLNV
jgi:hypothetical protein